MFQRLSSLFFGEVEEVAAELKGENPCVTEADEEGWMMVNLPGESPLPPPKPFQFSQHPPTTTRLEGSFESEGQSHRTFKKSY